MTLTSTPQDELAYAVMHWLNEQGDYNSHCFATKFGVLEMYYHHTWYYEYRLLEIVPQDVFRSLEREEELPFSEPPHD